MNRSVPAHPQAPPRPLTDQERDALVRIADVLIPARGADTAPSATPDYLPPSRSGPGRAR